MKFIDPGIDFRNVLSKDAVLNHHSILFGFGPDDAVNARFDGKISDRFERHVMRGNGSSLLLFHSPGATIQPISEPGGRFTGFCWGTLFDKDDGTLATAVAKIVRAAETLRSDGLGDLSGLFVAVILDQQENRLHLISDSLGARPFFTTEVKDMLFGSSYALALADFMPGRARADLDAISQYFVFGFNATNGSMIDGVTRIDAASHNIWAGQKQQTQRFGQVQPLEKAIGYQAMAEQTHAITARSYRHWTQGKPQLTFGLSGGFDSRYLCALSVNDASGKHRYINVQSLLSETISAQQVADKLGVPLEVIKVGNNDWDSYAPEGVFHCRPDGFPVTKSVCRLVNRQTPGTPMVDGFLGGTLLRGALDGILGRPEDPSDKTVGQAVMHKMTRNIMGIFKPEIKSSMLKRAYAAGLDTIENYKTEGHAITAFDIFMRQRFYISNNFLQNIDLAEPCLPFLDPDLISLKRRYPHSDFTFDTFKEIFARFMPKLAGLPHNEELKVAEPPTDLSRNELMWALGALPRYSLGARNDFLNKSFALPRMGLGLASRRYAYVIMPLMFLDMMLKVCETNNIALDWDILNEPVNKVA